MPDDYTKLKLNFFEKFRETEAAVKATEQAGGKFPIPVTDELYCGVLCAGKAEEEFSKGNRRGAIEKMQEATNHVRRASFDVLEYRFSFCSKRARTVVNDYIKGNEDFAFDYVLRYREVHSKNLFEIGNIIQNEELPSKDSSDYKDIYEDKIQKLQDFLNDFQASEPALVAAKKREKQAVQFQETHIWLSRMAIVVAALSGLVAILPYVARFFEFLWELITTQTP